MTEKMFGPMTIKVLQQFSKDLPRILDRTLPVTTRPPRRLCLTPEEAARELGISRPTVFRLLKSGALRSFTIGRRRKIAYEDVVAFIRARIAADNVPPE